MKRKMYSHSLIVIVVILLVGLFMPTAKALAVETPYESYTYNPWGDPVPVPDSYVPETVIRGQDLGIGAFLSPSDIFYDRATRETFLLDTGNNRIVVLDEHLQLSAVIEKLNNDGAEDSFNQPQGIFISEAGIYVADTQNQRILIIDREGNVAEEFGRPDTELISRSIQWLPRQLIVDNAGRIYVIATGVNMGLVELDAQGNFRNFKGAARVSVNIFEYILRRYFSTAEQRARMALYLPTEYSGMAIDDENFIYVTTNVGEGVNVGITEDVRRLNARGDDVLRRLGELPIIGDIYMYSSLVDVAVDRDGVYSVLGRSNGRIFTYDHDGNLLDIFGGIGFRQGLLQSPVALSYIGERIAVVDNNLHNVTVYKPTAYGLAMRQATYLYYQGDFEGSEEYWQIVMDYNANADLAYVGLGRIYMRNRDFERAMEYFRFAESRRYYSTAYGRYRRELIQENFPTVATVGVLGGIAVFVAIRVARLKKGKERDSEESYDVG